MTLNWVQEWTHGLNGILLCYAVLFVCYARGRGRGSWPPLNRWTFIVPIAPWVLALAAIALAAPTLHGWGVRPQGAFENYLVGLLAAALSYYGGRWAALVQERSQKPATPEPSPEPATYLPEPQESEESPEPPAPVRPVVKKPKPKRDRPSQSYELPEGEE